MKKEKLYLKKDVLKHNFLHITVFLTKPTSILQSLMMMNIKLGIHIISKRFYINTELVNTDKVEFDFDTKDNLDIGCYSSAKS
jgi:hypothetical protein